MTVTGGPNNHEKNVGDGAKRSAESKGNRFALVRRLGELGVELAPGYAAMTEVLARVLPKATRILGPDKVHLPLLPTKLAGHIAVDNALSLAEVEKLYLERLAEIPNEPLTATILGPVHGWGIRVDGRIVGYRAFGFSIACEGLVRERRILDELALAYRTGHTPQRRDPKEADMYVSLTLGNDRPFPSQALRTACAVMREAIPKDSEIVLLPREPVWEGPTEG